MLIYQKLKKITDAELVLIKDTNTNKLTYTNNTTQSMKIKFLDRHT